MRLGAHESIAGGIHRAFDRAAAVGCDAVQIFVKPNRSWAVPVLREEDVALFRAKAVATSIRPVVAHTSYLLNLASPEHDLWRRSIDTLIAELERCDLLGVPWLVLHPGAHVGTGEEAGLARMTRALGRVLRATRSLNTQILLETTAGQGTRLGYCFEHLQWLLDQTDQGERLGICLDTCHVFAAGYELRTADGYSETMGTFDRVIGLDRLKVVHLNDSKRELGTRKDRHEHIGEGCIGRAGFRHVLNDSRLAGLPGLLETPKSDDLHEDRKNLTVLRSLLEPALSADRPLSETTAEPPVD
ncbi:MAG: deoxyribonuclease IV [Anaerolineae bacterium]